MGPRTLALILSGMLAVYLLLLGRTGVFLMTSGTVAGFFFGLAVLVFPCVGAWIVWRELRFGFTAQKMSEELDPDGTFDADALDFESAKADAEANPQNWEAWFKVAVAYEDAGDKRQARRSMHHAASLFRADGQPQAVSERPTVD